MTIYDANEHAVFTLTSAPGVPSSGDVLLGPGRYTVRVVAGAQPGSLLPALSYAITGLVRSDPIGPDLLDPTLLPTGLPPAPPPPPPDPFDWLDFGYLYYLEYAELTDPYSNPWPS